MTYVPHIDEATCIAQGDCMELAPDVFDVGDVAEVIGTGSNELILEAARGHIPGYVDTGLNVVHVDDVAAGHLLAHRHGRIGERYILGGEDMTLQDILAEISHLVGRRPPRIRLPRAPLFPIAYAAEFLAHLRGVSTRVTVESLRMARKRMYFSSDKAMRELGYRWRPAHAAFEDAVRWLREQGLVR